MVQFASYFNKTRLIFPRINGPNVSLDQAPQWGKGRKKKKKWARFARRFHVFISLLFHPVFCLFNPRNQSLSTEFRKSKWQNEWKYCYRNSLVLPEVSASFEESFFSWTSEFLQEFYSHIFFAVNKKKWQCGKYSVVKQNFFYGLWRFLQFRQAYWCKGIIKKERFQLVLSFFLSRRSMRKNALKYVFDFMTFSSGNFNLITQAKANQSFSTLFHTK